MILERVEITNFRRFETAEFDLGGGLNLLLGPNGAGKTSILEVAHILARAKSFRRGRMDAMVRHGTDAFTMRARIRQQGHVLRMDVEKERQEPIRIRRERQPVRQVSEVAELIPLQVLLPSVTDLVFGAPAVRRQWLDWGVFHHAPVYAQHLRSFRRSLSQRNALLRGTDKGMLQYWDDAVVRHGEQVTNLRSKYFLELQEEIGYCVRCMCPELQISVEFSSGFQDATLASELAKQHARDVELGYTRTGPHKADVKIRLSTGTKKKSTRLAAVELSRGEGKGVACALKLAQARHLARRERATLFLIDDIASELDSQHSSNLLTLFQETNAQIIATTVSREVLSTAWLTGRSDVSRAFELEEGSIRLLN